MMNVKSIAAVMAAGGCVFLAACGDDGGGDHPMVGSWARVQTQSRTGSAQWGETRSTACMVDGTMLHEVIEVYGADGSWKSTSGSIDCDSEDGYSDEPDSTRYGAWRLDDTGEVVIYTYDDYAGEYESAIELVNDSELVLTHDTGQSDGTEIRTTYERQ